MKFTLLILLQLLITSISFSQKKYDYLEQICKKIDQKIGIEGKATLKNFAIVNKIESTYDLPSDYMEILDDFELSDWEGEIHDKLRSLSDKEFIGDFLDTKEIVLFYYLDYLNNKTFDVKKAVNKYWEEENNSIIESKRKTDSAYESFKVGDIVYFYPSKIVSDIYPKEINDKTRPIDIIPCKIIEKVKTDTCLAIKVIFDKNINAIKNFLPYLNNEFYDFFTFDTYFKKPNDLLKIKKGQPVLIGFIHFIKTNPEEDFRFVKFNAACFGTNKEYLYIVHHSENEIAVSRDNNKYNAQVIDWKNNGFQFEGTNYSVTTDKNRNVLYITNNSNKQQLNPIDCTVSTKTDEPKKVEYLTVPPNK